MSPNILMYNIISLVKIRIREKQNRSGLTDMENKPVVARGDVNEEVVKKVKKNKRYTLPVIK